MKKITTILLSLFAVLMLASCVSSTMVSFQSDVSNAEVYIDGEYIGKTPTAAELSNFIWNDPIIRVKKEGYSEIVTVLNKEFKPINIFLGLFFDWPAYFWCYGPRRFQYFKLNPENPAPVENEI